MELKFKYHKDNITYNIKPTDTVKTVKEKLSYDLGQLPNSVHFKFNNETLDDDELLQKYTSEKEPICIECDDDLPDDEEEAEIEIDTTKFELNPQSEFEIPSYTPPDFDEKVQNLHDSTGQDKAKCEQALRLAFFNADRAAEYLLSGEELPERPTILPFTNSSGTNYRHIPDRNQSKVLSELKDDEYDAFLKLMKEIDADYSTAIQYFIACDKNPELTKKIIEDNNK